ncbi:hypothetical protein C8R43DRAFT_960909 [Mycena crocata]|nr:hypothetical protein C8R43DRAFT_960909 [Mycena crocata]
MSAQHNTQPLSLTIPPYTAAVIFPFNFVDKLDTELSIIRQREISDAYYRGETRRPAVPEAATDTESSDSEDGSESDSSERAPQSSSPMTTPETSPSKAAASPAPRSSSAAPRSPEPEEPRSIRYAPYLRRYGFGPPLSRSNRPQPTPVALRPRAPLVDLSPPPDALTRGHLRAMEFRTFKWDLQPTPFIDRSRKVGAVMLGGPVEEEAWEDVVIGATAALRRAERMMDKRFLEEDTLVEGVVYGGTRATVGRPQNIRNSLENTVELTALAMNPHIQTIIAFQTAEARRIIERLRDFDSSLYLPFDRTGNLPFDGTDVSHQPTGFTSVEYQFSPANMPARLGNLDAVEGVSILTVLGDHDTRFSGDIIFWGSKMVAPFPPGSTLIFPAWWMPYSFTMVDRDEVLYVVLQRMDAGLYRFVENGLQSDASFERLASKREEKARVEAKAGQRERIVDMFHCIDDFKCGVPGSTIV